MCGALTLRFAAALAFGLMADTAWAGGDAEHGQLLYEQRCSACHSLDSHRVGPMHRGVFDRRAGSAAGYDYSPALRSATIIWNSQTLDAWLTDPEKLLPGQRMGYRVEAAADRADLIAYLQRESAAPR